jgi:hypothetical protein
MTSWLGIKYTKAHGQVGWALNLLKLVDKLAWGHPVTIFYEPSFFLPSKKGPCHKLWVP